MSEAESFGENRNSFVFPLTKMRRKLIISAGTLLDILPLDTRPDVQAKKNQKETETKTQQTKRCRGLHATEIAVKDPDSFVMCFPKTKCSGAKVAAWPSSGRREPGREPSGRSAGTAGGRAGRRRQQQWPRDRPRQVDGAE